MFKDAKVGDKVWSPIYGWGAVIDIVPFPNPLSVEFSESGISYYPLDGIVRGRQILFWDEIDMTPPLKPKREMTVDLYLNLYKVGEDFFEGYAYKTREEADDHMVVNRLGEAVHIKHTYKEG